MTRIPAPDGVAPAAQYSHVVLGRGRFVAVSGQVFENLRRCPAAAGATFDDVLKLTYSVTDMAHLPAIRAARAAHRGVRGAAGVNRRPSGAVAA
nr:hypothetical protein [Streptomyces sp. SID5470]